MNKKVLAGMLVALPSAMMGQTALDAFSISQTDMRGSARFMSMGGAFTALGGDISTLNQNPGGIGVYRSSDITATLDVTFNPENSMPEQVPKVGTTPVWPATISAISAP